MIYTRLAPIPHHIYGFVDKSFICKDDAGWMECAWFGIHAHAGKAITLTLHLESGAIYRHVPPHAFAFERECSPWSIQAAQRWDAFGDQFTIVSYPYLKVLGASAAIYGKPGPATGYRCDYLFSVEFLYDGFSEAPDQTKAFNFLRTFDNRLTIQPGDNCLFLDESFNSLPLDFPKGLKRADRWWEVGR